VICGIKILWGIKHHVDVMMTDDAGYMTLATYFPKNLLIIQFGPLYTTALRTIQVFTHDPVNVYYVLLGSMTLLPSLSLYYFLRKAGNIFPVWAFVLSLSFLLSTENMLFATWSRISHFAISIALIGLANLSIEISPSRILYKGLLLLFFLGFIRPEYHVGFFILLFLAVGYWLLIMKSLPEKETRKPLGIFLVIALVFSVLMSPLKGTRSYEAFAQQFAFNYCEWNKLSYYHFADWEIISKDTFGKFNKLSQAYNHNAEIFTKHILYNIEQYFYKGAIAIREVVFPSKVFPISTILAWIIIIAVLFISILIGRKSFYKNLKRQWLYGLVVLTLTLPSVAASIIYYTREHYRILAVPFFYYILIFIIQSIRLPISSKVLKTAGLILAFFICLRLPSVNDYSTQDLWHTYTKQTNLGAIRLARSLHIQDTLINTNHEGGLNIFLQPFAKNIDPRKKQENEHFEDFLVKNNINSVYYTTAYDHNFRYKKDSTWHKFLVHPELYNFVRYNIPNTEGILYFRKDILP
jgi:hypothetical protein